MDAGRIEVTGVTLEALVRAAYNPSQPRGLGHLHFQPGDLSDEDIAAIIDRGKGSRLHAISMDYVKGRAVKFDARRDGDRLFIKNRWYDHSDTQLRNLLVSVGLSPDLVDKARKEESDYIDDAIAKAVHFLRAHGGSYTETRERELPDVITTGLIYGSDPGPTIKREWVGSDIRYSLTSGQR